MAQLTVVIPVYNERETIEDIVAKIGAVSIDKEIIIVDNASTDGTQERLKKLEEQGIKVIYHTHNLGKGTSVRDGINAATADFVVLQDADLEYDPKDYLKLIKPALEGRADIVLGARFIESYQGNFFNRLGNRFLTKLINILFNAKINDYATCYKLAKREVFKSLDLKSKSFDIEVEIVCKALKKKFRISEVPVSYYPRSYIEGKKIRWFDGLHAIMSILKHRLAIA